MGHYVTKDVQGLHLATFPMALMRAVCAMLRRLVLCRLLGGAVRSGLWEAVEENGNVSKGVMVRARKGAAEKGSAFGQNVLQRNARGSPRGGSSGCCLLSVPLGA